MKKRRCLVCGKREIDGPWMALLNGKAPGPNMLAIGHARHHGTGLDLMGIAMPDVAGVVRCVSCLQTVTTATHDGEHRGPICFVTVY